MAIKIPFNLCVPVGAELQNVQESISGGHISGDGPFTRRCHALLEQELGVSRALLTTSCTHALEMAALLLEIKPNDEVIVPDFTFVSTINAFVLRGAKPVFCDIREDTLNLDERVLPSCITGRTRAIVPVHYAGVACEMDEIMRLARESNVAVVEDNAHGLFGRYRGRFLGTFGSLATQSFHETKNYSCGEGGALLINDPGLIERAEIIREKGTNRSRFFRGQVDKYSWVDIGSSYLLSDLLAAYLCAQLESRKVIQEKRCRLWNRYAEHLSAWSLNRGVRFPTIPVHCEQSHHIFYMLMSSLAERQAFIAHMRGRSIATPFHYLPLHLSVMGRGWGGREGQCPVSERVSEQLVRLPLYYALSESDQDAIIESVLAF